MDPEHIPIILNLGTSGILLYLYMHQMAVVKAMQEELRQVREEQWNFIVTLVGQDAANSIKSRRNLVP